MADIMIRQGDLRPQVSATLSDANGPIDLTNCTVKFLMAEPGTVPPKVNASAAVVAPPTAGKVTYTWRATDTDTAGAYSAVFVITNLGDGSTYTVPNGAALQVSIATAIL